MSTRYSAKIFVTNRNGEVLLLRRTEVRDQGKYEVPGGGVAGPDALFSGAVQELYEETGLKAEQADLVQISQEPLRRTDSKGQPVEIYYFAWPYDGNPIELGGGQEGQPEHDHYVWLTPSQARAGEEVELCSATAEALEKFFQREQVVEPA